MIIIPMAGASSRFLKDGYRIPKFMLPLWGSTVFDQSVKSFSKYFDTEHFKFVINGEFNTRSFVETRCRKLRIKSFSIFDVTKVTRGQAETVKLAIDPANSDKLIIFNIDTILHYDPIIDIKNFNASLDVFKAEGDHWSFVYPGNNNEVLRTTEKERISDLCSNGLYIFENSSIFIDAYNKTYNEETIKEHYIAPMFNALIANGMKVGYRLVDSKKISNCGVPKEYKNLLTKVT